MQVSNTNKETFIKGIHTLTGISRKKLQDYSETNNILYVIDHPMEIGATEKQIEKLNLLKSFINSYQYLRVREEENKVVFNNSEKLADYFKSQIAYSHDKEYFLVAYLDAKMHLMSCEQTEGTVNTCYVHPRNILKRALQLDCVGIALCHTHPSGSTSPSKEDLLMTKRICSIFRTVGLEVIDHIIIGGSKFASLLELGYMDDPDQLPKPNDILPMNLSHASEEEAEEERIG